MCGVAILAGLALFGQVIFVSATHYLAEQGDGIVLGQGFRFDALRVGAPLADGGRIIGA